MSKKKDGDDYEVGYKKPPKSGQFKPGKSGNPKGRPKGSKNYNTIFNDIINEVIDTPRGKMSGLEVILRQLRNKAAKGDLKAFDLIDKKVMAQEKERQERLSKLEEIYSVFFSESVRKLIEELMRVGDEKTLQFIETWDPISEPDLLK